MNELVYSGIGAQNSDQEIKAVTTPRPMWRLTALPLAQVNAGAYGRWDADRGQWERQCTGKAESLSSLCLGVISQQLHTYDPRTLADLEPQYARKVLKRVLDDRGVQFGTARSQGRPDDATVWLYGALADPEGWILHAPAHTIALPPSDTRTHLPPSRHRPGLDGVHPLAAAPPLFGRVVGDKFALITTLQLDSAVDNASVMALRYAPHLTVLWTRRCHGLSDDGVRMLAASLVPPHGSADAQGLWRLRAWYLAGCKQVGDGSMKSFARWPGLVLLDVRRTSCTEVAMNVFNRATQVFWGDRQDPFQECTDGLQGLFINADPDEMADRLAETLIKPDLPADPKGAKRHLTLNLIPSDTAPADFLLHEPKARASLPSFDHQRRGDQHSSKKVYKYDCGTIYGNLSKSVRNDDTREKRKDVKLALELQAEEAHAAECIARGEAPPEGRFDREWRERQDIWDREKRERKRKWNKPKIKVFKRPRTSVDDVAAAAANEHSKAFAVGKAVVREDSESLDDRTAMFVRMPVDGWEEMRYGVASAASSSVQVRRRVGAGVLDLLEAEEMSQAERGESTQSQSQSPSQPTVDANHDVKPSAAQLAGNRKPTPAQFASADRKPTPAQLAVAEKKPTRIQLASTDPTQSSQPSSVPSSQPFERAAKPNPFKPTQSHNPFATKPSGAAVNPFRSKESAGVPYGTVTPLKSDPTSSQSATPLSRSAAPFSSPTAKPSVTPLATRPESALKPAAESGTMPLSKPTQSVKPTRSNPFKSTPKATPTPSKSTQTKLNFLTKK